MEDPFDPHAVARQCLNGRVPPPGMAEWLKRARTVWASHTTAQSRDEYVRWVHRQVSGYANRSTPADWRTVDVLPSNAAATRDALPPVGPPVSGPRPPVAYAPPHPPPGGLLPLTRPGLLVEAEMARAYQLRSACTARLQFIYAAAPPSLATVLAMLDTELQRIHHGVQTGGIPSYFVVASEAVLTRVMHPHKVPPAPPHQLLGQQVGRCRPSSWWPNTLPSHRRPFKPSPRNCALHQQSRSGGCSSHQLKPLDGATAWS